MAHRELPVKVFGDGWLDLIARKSFQVSRKPLGPQTPTLRPKKIGNLGKSETVSFRVPGDLRLILEGEARKTGVALNTLVTHIFARCESWGQFAGRLKLLPVNKDLLREIFQFMQREKTVEIAKRLGETTGREEILFLFQQVNPQIFLDYMDIWTSHFDACKHNHDGKYDGKTHFYTVHHDVNLNFSIFTKEYLSSMIQSAIPRTVNFERVTPNALTFSFDLP